MIYKQDLLFYWFKIFEIHVLKNKEVSMKQMLYKYVVFWIKF